MNTSPKIPQGVNYALKVKQSVLFADLSLQGNKKEFFLRTLGIDYEPKYIAIDDASMYWNYEADLKFNQKVGANINVKASLIRYIDSISRSTRLLQKVSRVIAVNNNRSINQLISDLESYWYAYKLNMPVLFSFWNMSNIIEKDLSVFQKTLDNIATLETNDFIWEKWAFSRISQNTKNNHDLIKSLKSHEQLFRYIFTPFNSGQGQSIKELLQRATNQEEKISSIVPEKYCQSKSLISYDELIVYLAQSFVFWKSERLDVLSFCDQMAQQLYLETAKCLEIDLNQLFNMTSQEILLSLKQGKVVVSIKEITARNKAFCLILKEGQVFFQPPQSVNEKFTKETVKNIEIKGRCASKGIVKGICRIINDPTLYQTLKRGEILVTNMTRPEMGSALENAAAFVTDEGGVLCHAAIISREMSKPCIVGTSSATKILKTGDRVEVNADLGIVTKL